MSPENTNTALGVAQKLGSQVVRSLAPQFLALILVNVAFFAAFIWFANKRAEHTVQIMQQLLDSCLKR
jgi:hypothetical protein